MMQKCSSWQILERTLEPDSSDEEPPPVYSPPAYDMHIYDRKYPEAPPIPPPRYGQEEAGHATALSSYSYMQVGFCLYSGYW
ncbi:UNVERIFIED_CONTAM: hypothetical protein FKN15_051278 [Acipenser sinensis]